MHGHGRKLKRRATGQQRAIVRRWRQGLILTNLFAASGLDYSPFDSGSRHWGFFAPKD